MYYLQQRDIGVSPGQPTFCAWQSHAFSRGANSYYTTAINYAMPDSLLPEKCTLFNIFHIVSLLSVYSYRGPWKKWVVRRKG